MDYEKKYRDLVEAVKELQEANPSDEGIQKWVEDNVLELAESKDERIRKALIRFHKSTIDIDGIKGENILTWLEKQKEFVSADFDDVWKTADCDGLTAPLEKYSKDAIKKMCHAWYDKGIELERKRCLEKQGEKNTAKPKFHEGDWIVHNVANFVFQIVGVGTYGYNVVNREGYAKTISLSNEENYHLWTIQDAKPGDVLTSKNELSILIFRNLDTSTSFSSYYNVQRKGELGWSNECFIPATKEQRGLLFQKMKEEGYEWDAEKKELKNIKQSPSWSEEDEEKFRDVIRLIKQGAPVQSMRDHYTNWLKSLKERCTWMPSDEQIVALEHFVRSIGESGYASPYDNNTKLLYSLLNNLKKLRKK